MPINLSNTGYINNSLKSANNNGYISDNKPNNQSNGSINLSSLKSGETISGEVVALDGKNVTLKLSDGQMLNAKLDGNSNVALGKLLSFEVNTNSSNIILRPLFSNLNGNSTINAALNAAMLPLNEKYISMTQSMIEEGMNINKNALADMAKTVNAFPTADPATVVMMTKMGLPIDEITVSQFENYRNFQHQIINDVKNVADEIVTTISNNLEFGNSENIDLTGKFLSLIDTNFVENTLEYDESVAILSEEDLGLDESLMVSTKNAEEDKVISLEKNPADTNSTSLNETIQNGASQNSVESGKFLSELANRLRNIFPNDNNSEINATNIEIKDSNSFINELKELSNELRIPLSDTPSNGEVIDFLKNIILNAKSGLDIDKNFISEKFTDLFKQDDFKNIITKAIADQFSIAPEKISKEGQVEELYQRMLKFSQKIQDIASTTNQDLSKLTDSANNIQNNVHFMNEINQFVNYVQLPLKMAQENAHGELYVYSNKKNLSKGDGNLTALLHLDMEHLGPMDVFVSMKEFTNVTTNFRLSNEELLDFISENIHLLDERLAEKGYKMSSKVTLSEEQIGVDSPIADEFLKESPEEETMKNLTFVQFDVRA